MLAKTTKQYESFNENSKAKKDKNIMKNIENKEGSCKYYVPHYVKVGNSFITCRGAL